MAFILINRPKIARSVPRLALILAVLWLGVVVVAAQTSISPSARIQNGFAASHYERQNNNAKILQSTFTGESAIPVNPQQILIRDYEMITFTNGDPKRPQFVIQAPECILDIDPQSHRAFSTNRLWAFTPTTNFFLEGVGFFCSQTNQHLVISNSVHTLLPKVTNAASLAELTPNLTNTLQIYSDRLDLYYASNLVIYSGHVRVVDANGQMRCDYLEARASASRLGGNARIDHILAERNVTIETVDQGRISGDRAAYWVRSEGEEIEITGHARWKNGSRQSEADKFTYEPARHRMAADGNAIVQIPDSDLAETNSTGFLAGLRQTNQFTELSAAHLVIQMLPEGGIDHVAANDNLLITNRFKKLRATAQRGDYSRLSEQFELNGNAHMEAANQDEIRAKQIVIGRTDRSFTARGDSWLKMRIHGSPFKLGASKGSSGTNNFLSVVSDELDFRTNSAFFSKHVRASILEQDAVQGTLDSDALEVRFDSNNNLRSVMARGNVHGEATPEPPYFRRAISCEQAVVTLWSGTGNLLRTADLDGGVFLEQIEKSTRKGVEKKITRLNAGSVSAQFAPVSNLVDHAVALSNVTGIQYDGPATNLLVGQQADYNASPSPVVNLTGNPAIQFFGPTSKDAADPLGTSATNPGKLSGYLATGAEALVWDLTTGKFHQKGLGSIRPISAPVLFPETLSSPKTNR
jgi:lipopolysaccharide export system protein LptA